MKTGDNQQESGRDSMAGSVRREANEIEQLTGESPQSMLDLNKWTLGEDYASMMERTSAEVAAAIKSETEDAKRIREEVLPEALEWGKFGREEMEAAHSGLLFNGSVVACDGTRVVHDALPITITQIGVCLTSYEGQEGSYSHRIYRRDLRNREGEDPIAEALKSLKQRGRRDAKDRNGGDEISELLGRGLMAYAERAILLDKTDAPWRVGHGNPLPYELMTGHWAQRSPFMDAALDVMYRLVEHERFLYVPSRMKRVPQTLGNALRPGEYIVLYDLNSYLDNMLKGNYRGEGEKRFEKFASDVSSKIMMGVYRASRFAPPRVFYAHTDHTRMAALIAMADSIMQMHRGFPMLIDIADNLCRGAFGADSFVSTVQQAYAEAGQPYRYLSERETRR